MTLTVGTFAGGGSFASTLASLPGSYAAAEGSARRDVTVVGGTTWVAQATAAIAAGTRGVVISEPPAVPADDVRKLAERARAASVSVAVADPVADHPGLDLSADILARTEEATSADVWLVAAPSERVPDLLLRSARLLRLLGAPVTTLQVQTEPFGSIGAAGTCGRNAVLSVLATTASTLPHRARTRLIARDLVLAVELANEPARPAQVSIMDRTGERMLPRVYESAERAAWRLVHSELVGDREPVDRWDDLVDDLTFATGQTRAEPVR